MRWLAAFCLTCFEVFLVAALAYGIAVRGASTDPRHWQPSATSDHVMIVGCKAAKAPAPFACGDSIDQSLLARWKVVRWWQRSRAGESVFYEEKHRHGNYHQIAVRSRAEDLASKLLDFADLLNKLVLMSLGVLVVAKGRRPLAYPAGLFLYGLAAGSGINPSLVDLPDWLVIATHAVRQILIAASLFAFLVLALDLSEASIPARVRRCLWGAGIVLNAGLVLPVLLYGTIWAPLHFLHPGGDVRFVLYGLPLIAQLAPVVALAYAVTRASAVEAGVLRWVLASSAVGLAGPAINEISSAFAGGRANYEPLVLTEILIGLGFGYALIRHHVVEVAVVLNRAVVLGAITTGVAGIFEIAFDSINNINFLQNVAPGKISFAVLYIAVLVLGKSLHFFETAVDRGLDRLIFKRRVQIRRQLKSLLADCKRIGNADDLLRVCADQLRSLTGADRIAFYELRDGRYVPTSPDPASEGAPATSFVPLHRNDQVMLRITAQRGPVEAAGLATALPPQSVAFPILAAGRLVGALVCAARSERFDPEERRLLADFVRDIGATLVFLRSEYHSPSALTEHAVSDLSLIWSRPRSATLLEAPQPS
jgi:hypothetical protein